MPPAAAARSAGSPAEKGGGAPIGARGVKKSGFVSSTPAAALGCYSLQSLARETVATTAEFGLKGHVQFRTPGQTITLTENGPASPLEESVFDKMLGMGRIFS